MTPSNKKKSMQVTETGLLRRRIRQLKSALEVLRKDCISRGEARESSRDYLQVVIDNIKDPTLVIDRKYRIVFASKSVQEFAGVDPVKEGLYCYQISHHKKKPCTGSDDPCPMRKIIKTRAPVTVIHTHYNHDGNAAFVEIVASPIFSKAGKITHIIESCRDITERVKIEEALRESETRHRSLFEQSRDAIFILEAQGADAGRIISANKSACTMHGYTMKEMLRMSITDLDSPEYSAQAPVKIKRIVAGKAGRFELMHRKKNGALFPVEVSASTMKLSRRTLILAIYRDISLRRRAEQEKEVLIKELEKISQVDGLTELLNRQYLNRRLTEEMKRAKRYGNPLSLIMFDIDNFKKINDTYGHIAGDKILMAASAVVKRTLRDTDIAGRFGGDEFIVVLVQTDIEVGRQVAERIHLEIEQTKVDINKVQSVGFTISVGLCRFTDNINNVEDFISKADKAVYAAKHSGHNRVCVADD